MLGKACLPSNAYYLRTPHYTLYSGVHVCWSEDSDSSFVYGFMSLDSGLSSMATTIVNCLRVFGALFIQPRFQSTEYEAHFGNLIK